MNEALLLVEKAGGITTLVINRPEKRNAFTRDMWVQFTDLIGEIESDDEAKVLILQSSDRLAFSAGADISEFRQVRGKRDSDEPYNQAAHRAETALALCTKPTIAMISGFCVGGGCGLAVACDFRFADSTARLGVTPARLGLVYSLVGTKRLVDLVGPANAKLLLVSGELLDARRAERMGLFTELCTPDELVEKTYTFARTIASRAQHTVRSAKSIIEMILRGAVSETDESRALQEEAYASEDYREGVRAFLEGRTPHFS